MEKTARNHPKPGLATTSLLAATGVSDSSEASAAVINHLVFPAGIFGYKR